MVLAIVYKPFNYTIYFVAIVFATVGFTTAQGQVVITYAGGYTGNLIDANKIQPEKLTHLLYAFANLSKKGKAYLNYPKTDQVNLHNLVALKRKNPKLKVMLSVGGLGWSVNFSAMAMTESGRQAFTESCMDLVKKYELDGIDLDWEFPGYAGEGGNPYRADDKSNFTLLCKTLRKGFNRLQQKTGRRYILTAAVDGWAPHFLPHTEMEKVQLYLDYVCLMTYNFNTGQLAGGHYLFSPNGWDPEGSMNGSVTSFLAAGVPASKLVVGAGFFPAAMIMQTGDPQGRLYRQRLPFRGGLARVNHLIGSNGYIRFWDNEGKAPYLFNSKTRVRIEYEDAASVKNKCAYIKSSGLAGIMYWDYFSDPGRRLLTTIYQSFHNGTAISAGN